MSLGCQNMNKTVTSRTIANDKVMNMRSRPRLVVYHGANAYKTGNAVVVVAQMNTHHLMISVSVSMSRVMRVSLPSLML